MKRTPITRRTSLKKRRSKPRRGQPTAKEKSEVRRFIYDRAGGQCELHLEKDCIAGILPFDGGVFERAHLVHLKSRGAGGTWDPSNLKLGCWKCHLVGMHTKGLKIDE